MTNDPRDRRHARPRRHRRALIAAALFGTVLAAGQAALASSGDTTVPASEAPGGSEAESGTRTITHALGTVEVPADPQRIASVGYEEQQLIYHFGKVPVILREYYGEQPYATWPWDQPYLGDATPEVFTEEMPFERIAAAEPDLIMAINAGLTPEQYERLSEIAPTVAQPVGYDEWNAPSDVQLLFTGEVFGMEDEARAMLDETDAQLADIAAAHPEWADLYAGSLTYWDPIINADTTEHARGQLLAALGFEEITEDVLPFQDGYPTVPLEEIDKLDALDVGIWINGDPTPDAILGIPLRDALALHTEGREVYAGPVYAAAFGTLPHQVDFLMEWLVPELEAAVDGEPATPVPSAVEAGIAPEP